MSDDKYECSCCRKEMNADDAYSNANQYMEMGNRYLGWKLSYYVCHDCAVFARKVERKHGVLCMTYRQVFQ